MCTLINTKRISYILFGEKIILGIKGFIYVKSKIYTIQIKMLLIANRFKDNNFKFDSKDVSYLQKIYV